MIDIVALSKEKGSSSTTHSSTVTLDSASILKIPVSREDIKSFSRVNNDLIIELNDNEKVTIKNFFTVGPNGQHSDLVIEDPHDGALWWLENPGTDAAKYTSVNSLAEVGSEAIVNEHIGAWAIAGAALLGIGAMLLGSSLHGHSESHDSESGTGSTGNNGVDSETKDSTAPAAPTDIVVSDNGLTVTGKGEAGSTVAIKDADGNSLGSTTVGSDGTFSVTLPTAQANGQTLTVTATDVAGNTSATAIITAPDTTAPAEPSGVQLSDDGKTISGKGEAGSTVAIKDADGNTLGSATVGSDGTFSVTLPAAQANGQTLTVTATDAVGNTSAAATITAPDTTAPAEPSGVQLSDDGKTISGKGEAGSTVAIKDADGNTLASATVGSDGIFSVTLLAAQANGQTLTVTATDAAGNTSATATITVPDTTAPAEPSGVQLSDDGLTVTGKGEAGSIVAIKDADGNTLASATVGSDGIFSVTMLAAQANGQTLTVTATDAVGNTSAAATITAPDTTAPAAPTDITVSDDGATVTGKGEAGSTVAIKDADGTTLGSTTVGSYGTFSVTLPAAQTNGQTLTVTATDVAKNTSAAAIITAPDTTAPAEPSGVQLSDDGKTISGKGEAGSTVAIKDGDGNTLGSATVGSDGTFSVTLPTAQANGEILSVTATDVAGNTSAAATITAPDTTAPAAPTDITVSDDGATVTGKGEAGSTVAIKDADGNTLGSTTVGSYGTFSVTLLAAQANGQTLTVTATDAAGNTSAAATITAPDTTAPAEPSGVQLSDDGKTISGKGEAGSTVAIKDADGNTLGSATVGSDGTFSVTLPAAQANGQTLTVTATDVAGNTSAAATITAPDTTAPAAPTDITVSDDGATVTGKGEAGSTVAIKDADGNTLASATVGSDGIFSVTLLAAQANGQTLTVTATDAVGNTSAAATITAPDTTASAAPTDVAVSADGDTVNGKAEAGSTVTIKDADGNTLGSTTVGSDGTFSVTLTTAQTNGETLTVTATDAAKNTSAEATTIAPDTTAPAAPTDVTVSADGDTVTGKAEAGSTVTVKDADGNTIGSATAGSDGTFSVTLTTAQTNAQTLSVTATDAAKNTSAEATTSAPDTTAPAEPSGVQLSDDGKTISGKGEAGSTIAIKDADGNTLGSATVGSDGTFSVTLPAAQANGQTLSVTATDAAGNTSAAAAITAPDTTAPEEPSGVQLSDDGKTISGKGEAGSTIAIKDADGNTLGSTTVGSDGTFSVTLPTAQSNGQTLTVTTTDAAGNVSPAATITAPDTTAPAEPSGVQLRDDGKTISGKGEAGSTVAIKDADGNTLASATVGSDGTFSLTLPAAQTNGQTLTVTTTDAAGNVSPAATITAPDTTAPEEPSGVQLSDDGLTVTGKDEAGSTVAIKDADGNTLGSTTVGSDGTFSVTLPTAQTNGQTLSITATDAAGNVSPAAKITAPDTTAPAAPTDVTVSDDGATVTGKAEAGSTVAIKDSEGNTIGSATVAADGSFTAKLDPAQTNGETLSVTTTDTAGNTSAAITTSAPDTTVPAAPTGVAVGDDGATVIGKAEAGSTVAIKDAEGNTIGSATVAADGSFTAKLDPAQTNGETLSVTTTDTAGNTSAAITTSAPDTTAPTAPTDVAVSDDGATVTGKAEAGSTVTIKDTEGNTIGSATAGSDGTFSVTLTTAQTNGETLTVTATDVAKNTSAEATAIAPDTTVPAAPTDIAVSTDGDTVTGKAEAGSIVTIKDADGNTIGSATVAADGSFTATLDPAQTNGETLTVTATDAAKNISAEATAIAPDTTVPAAPTDIAVSTDGDTVTGKAEAGSTVTIKDADGNTIGSATVAADGSFTAKLDPAQTNGETLTVTATDTAKNTSAEATTTAPDTTAPAAPTDIAVSDDGATVTGKAEAGSTVAIKDAEGNTIGSATVAADGSFTATLDPAQTNGETLTVTATDTAKNTSAEATTTAPDTTAPAAPTDIAVSDDGATVTGKAEAGSTVAIKDAEGNTLGSATAGSDGTFSVTLTTAQTNGETLTVTAMDAAKNTSAEATTTAPDTTAPAAPSDVAVSDDGATVTGKAEAGSTVAIKDADGNTLGSATAGSDGTFSVTLTTAQTNGETLTVTATDAAQNTSAEATAIAPDTTVPAAPTDIAVSADGDTVTGKAEAGSTVAIKDADGNTIGSATVAADGSFTAALDPAQTNGETLTVTATDAAKNTSAEATTTAPDTTAPAAPTDIAVSTDGDTVTGKAEAGSTVTIKDADGNTIGSATVSADGSFTAKLDPAQTNGETLTVTATDTAKNTSAEATTTAPDTTAPAAPTDIAVSDDGATVTGKAEAGSTVAIKDTDGNTLGSATAGSDGTFSVTLTTAQTNGETLTVTATDAAKNTSAATTTSAPDTTAPAAPTDIAVSDDGATVTGKAEAGSTVAIKDADGNTLGSATVGSDGTFSVTLTTAQTNGETLTVTATDAAKNTSVEATTTAPDTTAPAAPTDVTVSDDGATVTGKAEAGSTVTIKDAEGNTLGSATAGSDGTFSVTLTTAQTNGETLSATATDTAGNTSAATTTSAPDTTAPAVPSDVQLSDDGITVTGKGDVGSIVTVKDAEGNTLGSATVGSDGTFSVTLTTAQTNGQVLSVAASDTAGNTSIATSVTAQDTTAPAAPTDVVLSDDGVTVTGKGEVGSIITVTNANGKALGTGKVDSDGTFSVTLDAAQTNGQTLSVAASDTLGNTSEAVSVTAKDTTAPNEPTDLVIDDSALTLSGKGEEGTTVKVYDSNGNVVATGTVNDDGTFEVKLPEGLSVNQDLSVTLTDSSNNESDKGTITYSDNSGSGTDDQLIANADTHTATVTAVQDNLTGTSGNIVQAVGLTALSVVDVSLFSSNTFNFTVSDNTSEDVTLDVSGSVALSAVAGLTSLLTLLGLNSFSADLSVIDTSTGEVVQTLSNAITINSGLVNLTYSGSVYIQGLTSGTYTVAVSSANSSSVVGRLLSLLVSANVGTVLSVDITDSVQYVFGDTSGNVLSSDTAGDVADTGTSIHVTSVVADSVDGASAVTVASSGSTTITGKYGVLTIAADGSYSYQPTSATSDIGKSDVFTYTITNASGQTATATLTLTIEGTHSTAVADEVSVSTDTELAAGTSLTYTTNTLISALTIAKSATVSNSATESFTVASGTMLDSASLVLKFSAANNTILGIANLSTTTISGTLTILNETTGESESTTLSSFSLATLNLYTSTQTISLSSLGLGELTEGNYTVTFVYSASNSALLGGAGGTALTVTSSLSGTSVDTTHHYTESETVTGNILDGTDSDSVADTFGSEYQSFTITGNNASGTSVSYTVSGGDKSITDASGSAVSGDSATLYGKYGTLVLSDDGSYTYTLKAGIDTSTITSKETFSYSLNDSDGTSSTANLTIDLHPVITGSANADTITSTAYDDTFTTESGADTVMYKLLADDNTGGNGSDTWTDFSVSDGDHIDVSALLVGWDGESSTLGNYVSVSHTDGNTVVSIDRDGTGSAYSSTTLVTLEGVNVTLDELIDHNSSS